MGKTFLITTLCARDTMHLSFLPFGKNAIDWYDLEIFSSSRGSNRILLMLIAEEQSMMSYESKEIRIMPD